MARVYKVKSKITGEFAEWYDLDKKEVQSEFETCVEADYLRDYMNLCVCERPEFETVCVA